MGSCYRNQESRKAHGERWKCAFAWSGGVQLLEDTRPHGWWWFETKRSLRELESSAFLLIPEHSEEWNRVQRALGEEPRNPCVSSPLCNKDIILAED